MRSGLESATDENQQGFQNNLSLAQQAIENYKFLEKPAMRLHKRTKFQDFELYKKTNDGQSQPLNGSDSPINRVKNNSPEK